MRSVFVVALGISSIAMAERDAAVRGGVCLFDADSNQGTLARGFAPYLEGEVGVRSDGVSWTATGSVFSLRSQFLWSDQTSLLRSDARYVATDLGGRMTVHGASREGLFWGLGLALESIYETGQSQRCQCENARCDPCTGGRYEPFGRWNESALFEMHAGFDLLTRLGVLDVIAIASYSGDPDPVDNSSLWTLRVATGLRF